MSTPSASPHRRRPGGSRRPRVAGRIPASSRGPGPRPTDTAPLFEDTTPASRDEVAAEPDGEEASPAHDEPAQTRVSLVKNGPDPAADESEPVRPTGKRLLGRRGQGPAEDARSRRGVSTRMLAVAAVVLVAAAVVCGIGLWSVLDTPAARNTALVDVGTTAQVNQQVDDALKTIYSFDYTRLDQNEAAARAVITPAFDQQFSRLFQQVRQLAPQQKAVVTATVATSAVRLIDGDHAELLVFLDQQATRADGGGAPQQLAAAGRLSVSAEKVGDTWKIADVQPR